MAATKRRLTDEEREERREQERQLAQDAVEALRSSEGWQRWIQTQSRFHRYSFGNQILIALQNPEAHHVAGFRKWLELGYCVRKGEMSIRIWAPIPPSKRKVAEAQMRREETGEKSSLRTFFKLAPVFGDNQVDALPEPAKPAPLDPPIAELEGDSLEGAWMPLCDLVKSYGHTVEVRHIADRDTHGFLHLETLDITIGSGGSMNRRVKTLVHEAGHLLIRVDDAVKNFGRKLDRAEEELVVESIAMSVCGALGFDTAGYSIPYLASWAEATDIEVLEEVAKLTNTLARIIEDALPVELVGMVV